MKDYWNNMFKNRDIEFPYEETLNSDIKYFNTNKLLDIGSGDGRNLFYFLNKGFDVTCLDYSDVAINKLIKKARRKEKRINTYVLDIYENKIDDHIREKFDTITMIHFFPNIDKLTEIKKLLESNGIIYCTTFINDNLNPEQSKFHIGISRMEIFEMKQRFKIIYENEIENSRGLIYTFVISK